MKNPMQRLRAFLQLYLNLTELNFNLAKILILRNHGAISLGIRFAHAQADCAMNF